MHQITEAGGKVSTSPSSFLKEDSQSKPFVSISNTNSIKILLKIVFHQN